MAEGDDKMSSEAMWGNIGFLLVAISHVAHPALDMFRYTSDADYWNVTTTTFGDGATNWWKLYNQIGQYGISLSVLSSPSPSSSPCSELPLRSTSCFGATPPCSSDPSSVPPSLVSPCGATTRLTNSVMLTTPATPMLAKLWTLSRVICSGKPLVSSPWVLPSWNPMKAGCRLNSWPSPRRPRRSGWKST